MIDRVPENIKCISTFSIGFDHIDLEACKARGIKVGNAPHGVTVATAEIAMLLLLGSARRASEGERMIRTRSWPGWQPLQLVGQRLDGKKLGIYGFGKIGQALAQARPRLRHGDPLLRHLPAAAGEGEGARRHLSRQPRQPA